MKNISILGSTGSIGRQALEIIRQNRDKFNVVALTCNRNIELLRKQVDEFKPLAVAVMDKEKADQLDLDIPIYKGIEGIMKIATLQEANMILNSLVGSIGVIPTIKAIENLKDVALANKESLVTAGKIIMEKLGRHKTRLLPIDSEHSAILQCIRGEDLKDINRIILTCSGGPFINKTKEELENVKAEDALKHPTWNMGAKITIDSATLMNKGLEVIEAHWLFGLDYDKIDVVIHPQSIVHSLVEFKDKSVLAQLGLPDMKLPIQYALSFPKRITNTLEKLDLTNIGKLEFGKPDFELFPCLPMAYEAGIKSGTLPVIMNAANEIAVEYFLQNKIKFLDIPKIIKYEINKFPYIKNPSLTEIIELDKKVKEKTRNDIEQNII